MACPWPLKKSFYDLKGHCYIRTKTTEYLDISSLESGQILFSAYIFVKTFFILRSRSNFGKNECQQLCNNSQCFGSGSGSGIRMDPHVFDHLDPDPDPQKICGSRIPDPGLPNWPKSAKVVYRNERKKSVK